MRLWACLAHLLCCCVQATSEDLDSSNYLESLQKAYTSFVLFSSSDASCAACRKVEPRWDELADKFDSVRTVLIGSVDCSDMQRGGPALCARYAPNVPLPSMLYFLPGDERGEIYDGDRDLAVLATLASSLSACAPVLLEACSPEQHLELAPFLKMPMPTLRTRVLQHRHRQEEARARVLRAHQELGELARELETAAVRLTKRDRKRVAEATELAEREGASARDVLASVEAEHGHAFRLARAAELFREPRSGLAPAEPTAAAGGAGPGRESSAAVPGAPGQKDEV
jgi:hypothetical protein